MFLSELDIRVVDHGKFELLAPLIYKTEDGRTIEVPAGFITDFASIPRALRWLVTGQGNTRKPSVIHDFLYQIGPLSRKNADKVFLEAMHECGVKWWKRSLCYSAVRTFGWVTRLV